MGGWVIPLSPRTVGAWRFTPRDRAGWAGPDGITIPATLRVVARAAQARGQAERAECRSGGIWILGASTYCVSPLSVGRPVMLYVTVVQDQLLFGAPGIQWEQYSKGKEITTARNRYLKTQQHPARLSRPPTPPPTPTLYAYPAMSGYPAPPFAPFDPPPCSGATLSSV